MFMVRTLVLHAAELFVALTSADGYQTLLSGIGPDPLLSQEVLFIRIEQSGVADLLIYFSLHQSHHSC